MQNKKITIAEFQKNPEYRKLWKNVDLRVDNVQKAREKIDFNETDVAIIVLLLSRCENRIDFDNLRKKIYILAKKMEFWDVRE